MTKASIALLLRRLTPNDRQRQVFLIAVGVVAAWTLASFLAVALQCDLGAPWIALGASCSGSAARWQAIGAFDIITEIGLVMLAAYLVWDLKMMWQFKVTVVIGFAVRLL